MDSQNAEKLSITLPAEMVRVIREKVASGAYSSNSEVIRDALRESNSAEMPAEVRPSGRLRFDWVRAFRTVLTIDATMKLAKYTKYRDEKFGGVLFETRSERVYSLNPAAAAIVREIAPGVDEREIVERLKARFNDAGSTIEREALPAAAWF